MTPDSPIKADLIKQSTIRPDTLTRDDMERLATERIIEITNEFEEGFKLLENFPQSVTFFGSTYPPEDDHYYVDARALASKIVKELGYSVLTGGGPGIMEAANRGAYEAGGNSLGLTIELPTPQKVNRYITKEVDSYYFFVRKVLLSFSAEAFIFYPGGFGTMDEFFEILTLVQTRKIEGVPIICVGVEYWTALVGFMKEKMLPYNRIINEDLNLFHITDDHDEIVNIIKKVPVKTAEPYKAGVGAAIHADD